jgi:Xaa-Pro aminopeptidase
MVVHVWHISCDGYWSAIVRTVLIDEVDQQARTVHRVVHEVQQEAKESIKAGVIASDLAKRARERLNYEGLGKYFRGIVGRGIGLSWAEAPSISLDSDDVLQPGMVLRVECVVFSQGLGGFGIEDTVVVSRDGTEALTV